MASMKPKMIRLPDIIKTRRIYANKRKYFGGKNQGFNGLKKENTIQDFSTNTLWQTEYTT